MYINNIKIRNILFIILLFCSIISKGQGFEGSIHFLRQSLSDTLEYTYHVKDNFVRVDAWNEENELDNSLLVNLETRTMTALNHSKKLFKNIPVKNMDYHDSSYEVKKLNNYKHLHGYKCYQWLVENREKNTIVSYWVAKDNFYFFEDLLRILNRTEKSSVFYLQIPDTKGYFPMLSVERDLLREVRMRLEVLSIEKKKLGLSMFQIPENYNPFK